MTDFNTAVRHKLDRDDAIVICGYVGRDFYAYCTQCRCASDVFTDSETAAIAEADSHFTRFHQRS